jgi:hypothetical protein
MNLLIVSLTLDEGDAFDLITVEGLRVAADLYDDFGG